MLNQKKVEIFLVKFRKSLAKQFLEVAYSDLGGIQTPDFQNRNLTFYSAELRGQKLSKPKY